MKEIENREEPDNKDNQINYTANKLILGSSVNPKLPAVWSLLDRCVGFKFSILLMLQFTFGMLGASQLCSGNQYLNTSTSTCDSCPYGQFYVDTLAKCVNCDGSCNSSQVFDLDSYTCVDSCNTTTSVLISDAQFSISSICRGFNYYVDPTSLNTVELGTMQFPYKTLGLVFVELLNFHANSGRTINIYLMENSTNYIDLGFNYVINITMVNIHSYSSTSSSPAKATILAGEINSPSQSNITAYFNSGTTFNILQSTELRKTKQIFSNTIIGSTEMNYLQKTNQVVMVQRSNFTISNMTIISEFNNINSNYIFFFSVYLQNRNFTMTNINFNTSGAIFVTYDPLNLSLNNIDVNYDRNNMGIELFTYCNYPEAFLQGGINITNIKFYYNSGGRLISNAIGNVLRYIGSNTFYVDNFSSSVYGVASELMLSIYYQMQTVCTPALDVPQYVYFNRLNLSQPFANPNYEKIQVVCTQSYVDTYRQHIITYSNFSANNIADNVYPHFWSIGNALTKVYFDSLNAYNVSTKYTVIFSRGSNNVVMKNLYYNNCTASNQYLLMFSQGNNLSISNVTMNNVLGKNSNVYSFIYIEILSAGNVTVDGLYISNSNFDQHDGIYVNKITSSAYIYLTIKNCIFSNNVLKSNVLMINSNTLKSLVLSNITVSQATQSGSSDLSNLMINIGGLDLNTTEVFTIDNIFASQSTIALLKVSNLLNTNIANKTIAISNIGYSNSTFQYFDSLIQLYNIEVSSNLKLSISNLSFSNITFIREGNVVWFQQQTSESVVVTNSTFNSINGGRIQFEAYDKNNLTLTTNMSFDNMIITNCNSYYQSMLSATTGATISISNSKFTSNCNYINGAVASVDTLGTSIKFYNSVFQNNTSIKGGVLNVENQGFIYCSNCSFQTNFAIQSGVIQVSNDGYYEIHSSIVSNNYAYSLPVTEFYLSSSQSIIEGSSISNNKQLSSSTVIQEISSCNVLCFLSSDFKTYLTSNPNLMKFSQTVNSIQLISSSLLISNSFIDKQDYFLSSLNSNFTFNNSTIENCVSYSSVIYLGSTNFVGSNLTFINISMNDSNDYVMSALFDSTIIMNNISYANSTSMFLNSYAAVLSLQNIDATLLSIQSSLFSFSSCSGVKLININIHKIDLSIDSMIYASSTSFDLLQNLTLSEFNTTGYQLISSNVTKMLMCSFARINKGMIIQNSNINLISNSTFSSCGLSNVLNGGAIDIIDSKTTIESSKFISNVAQNGAAVSIRCSNYNTCINKISNSNLNNNRAIVNGGGIYYSLRRPNLINVQYSNNSANYGANIASYPVKIVEVSSLNTSIIFTDIPSGIKMSSILQLALQDLDGQTIPEDLYQIKISSANANASVSGYDSSRTIQGIATFTNLVLISKPGATHVAFKATSNAISSSINQQLGMPTVSPIDVSFRYCQPGEAQVSDSVCQTCSPGTYSFDWNSTSCANCMSSAVCSGGSTIDVSSGYWRLSTNSTNIISCPYPAACLGGYHPEFNNPVQCEDGYTGLLCLECGIVDGFKYEKVSSITCARCSNPTLNALKFIGVVIAAFAFLMIMIIVLIRKKKENQTSILIRILTNYLQLISVSMTFNVKFPVSLSDIFGFVDTIGSSSDAFLSYDCFFNSAKVTGFTPSVDLFKVLLTGLLPLILFCACALIFVALYFSWNSRFGNIKLNLIISLICIIFLLHPTITRSSLLVFECITVDTNDKRMKLYMEYKCYSQNHFFWIACVAFPILFVWVIGAPLLALGILYKHRKTLDDGYIKTYMMMLYQGLRPEVFYWEFVNTLRKSLILCCSVFLSTESTLYKILISVIILIFVIRVQMALRPYKYEENNILEQSAINAGAATLMCGIIFSQDNNTYQIFNTLAIVFLVYVNAIFLAVWLFHFLLSLNIKQKYFKIILEIYALIVFKKRFLIEQTLKTEEATIPKTSVEHKRKRIKILQKRDLSKKNKTKQKFFSKFTKKKLVKPNKSKSVKQFCNSEGNISNTSKDISINRAPTVIELERHKVKQAIFDDRTQEILKKINANFLHLSDSSGGKVLEVCYENEELKDNNVSNISSSDEKSVSW